MLKKSIYILFIVPLFLFAPPLPIPTATFDPLNNAPSVSISQDLILTLSANVVISRGPSGPGPGGPVPVVKVISLPPTLTLYKADHSIVQSFNLSVIGPDSSVIGPTITLKPNVDLEYSTSYYIKSPSPLNYIDTFAGRYSIDDTITWAFITESVPASTPVSEPDPDPEPESETKPDHKVSGDGGITRVVSFLGSAITAKLPEGVIRTTAGNVDLGNGFYVLAVADTTPDGKAITYFLKVSETDPTDITVIGYTYSQGTPFPAGTLVEIKKIDGILYIVVTSPLSGTLTVQ